MELHLLRGLDALHLCRDFGALPKKKVFRSPLSMAQTHKVPCFWHSMIANRESQAHGTPIADHLEGVSGSEAQPYATTHVRIRAATGRERSGSPIRADATGATDDQSRDRQGTEHTRRERYGARTTLRRVFRRVGSTVPGRERSGVPTCTGVAGGRIVAPDCGACGFMPS